MTGANLYQLDFYTTHVILNGTREQMARQRLRKVRANFWIAYFLYVQYADMIMYISDK